MKKSILAGLVAALLATGATTASAFDPFVVKDIRVEGIQRTEAGTVFSYLPVKVGDTLDDDKASKAIKALFATGFFKDVRLEIEGDVLVVILDERPAINSLEFVGMKAFEKDPMLKALKELGLSESRIFDRSLLEKAEQEIKRQYLSRGYYGANVTTTVTPLERNRVGINFNIVEGEVAKIHQINIIGSKAFPEKDLLELFQLRTPGWFTWYTKNDQYSKQKLSADLETLRSHYLDNGYLEFNVDSTQVSISPDKKDIYITINVTEGQPYKIASIKLAGNLLLPEDELKKLVTVKPGDSYSRARLTDTTKAISDRLGNDGYAFANVNAAPELNKEKLEAAFTIYVDPGRKVYVRRINVTGNNRTRDEVVRREFRQMESAWYDAERINKSKKRANRLGYFEDVVIETPPVAGTTDQVDLEVKVKERPTGNLMLGAGFSSSEKLVLSGSIEQQNLFGSGRSLGVQLNTSRANKVYSMSYTNPYYTVDGVSRGFDIYKRKTDTSQLSSTIATYDVSSWGGGVRYGVPIGDEQNINFGLSYDSTTLGVTTSSPQRYQDFVAANGTSFASLVGSIGWGQDTVDSRLYPTSGFTRRIGGELTMPGSNLRYYKASFQQQNYFPLSKTFTLMLNGEAGLAHGFGDRDLPFWKNFYAGGIGSVRGFDTGSLGPRDASTDTALGGTRRLVGNAELLFPLPGSGTDKSLRLSAFVDGGNVWGQGESIAFRDIRFSTGVAVTWSSFMGPLKFSFATPIKKETTDKIQRLQFQFGSSF
ncbi:MAG: outer membrane protein assembly factor BamA [Rhodocyclaceae bacterium]|nr:MAG: outer membrane protein assembly factor BamA [Rhodocyclaceae bacterium]